MTNFRAIGRISALAAAVAMIAGAAVPASAAGFDPTNESAPAKQEKKAKKSQQYCVQDEITGSRMPRKICKTRAEWIQEDGFDPIGRN